MAPKNTGEKIVDKVKLPVTFKEFAKEPVKALLFIVVLALGYMYVDSKMNYKAQIANQGEKIVVLEGRVETLTNQLRRSDSALAAAISKITVLQELGKIK